MSQAPATAILLEDDAIAAEVLTHQLQRLGFAVVAFDRLSTLHEGLAASLPATVALIDLGLPDGDGGTALPWLRPHCQMLLATSADWTATSRQMRINTGFDGCLDKPCSLVALQAALATVKPAEAAVRAMPETDTEPRLLPVFDDAMALSALGSLAAVRSLRGLFREELQSLAPQIAAAETSQQWAALRPLLHRLAASSGFVGARALKAAVTDLHTSLSPEAGARLNVAVAACLEALSQASERYES